jgi:protocatechuate 3,4-dioxygenase beta subunit
MRRRVGLQTLMVLATLCAGQSPADAAQVVRCTGRVIDGEGRPVAGVCVTTYEALSDGLAGNFTLQKAAELITPEDGAFAFAVPPKPTRGTLFVWSYVVAAKEGLAPGWAIWNMQEDMATALVLGEPGSAEGFVVDEAGRPIADARVLANLIGTRRTAEGDEKKEWLSGLALRSRLETRTNREGWFVLDGLPKDAGIFYLISATGKATIYTRDIGPGEQPPVRPGQTGVRFVLPEEGRITGRILDPNTGAGLAKTRFAVVPKFSALMYDRLVCTTDENGTFTVSGLKAGMYRIRGPGLPNTDVDVRSGATIDVTLRPKRLYYGRILFNDGTPAVIRPAPWPGAGTNAQLIGRGGAWRQTVGAPDDEGYFRVHLSEDQFRDTQAGKAELQVYMRYKKGRARDEAMAPTMGLLARDKEKAGVAKVPRPHADLTPLLGHALPPLDPIGHGAQRDQARDKAILVCFFDVDQRPSRNCLLQMGRRFDSLTAGGLVVLGVQASRVEQDTLTEWLTQNGLAFPVGQIAMPEEITRAAWGVKSLPWLILADREKKVVAEGFPVQELDACLGKLGSP